MNFTFLSLFVMCILAFTGCGQRMAVVSGGTKGILVCERQRPEDIRLTFYPAEAMAAEPVGFAVTQKDGVFELYANQASGPLWLQTGKYKCTLESVGAPLQIPKAYRKPETTPLTLDWAQGTEVLEIHGPALKAQ